MRLLLAVPATLLGGWTLADGLRAFLAGDYYTPVSGPHAGQLGPWAGLLAGIGLDPRSVAVKAAHIVLGADWMAAAAMLYAAPRVGWLFTLYCAVFSLWYVPFGTVVGLAAIGLLAQRSVRESLLQAGSRHSFASGVMPLRPPTGAPRLRRSITPPVPTYGGRTP